MRYLSDEWLAAADTALRGLRSSDVSSSDTARVGFVVTDGPDGDRRYALELGPNMISIGEADPADVTLTVPWSVAASIARGESSAQRAVLDGKMTIGGDVRVLLGRAGELAAVDDALSSLRSQTEFD